MANLASSLATAAASGSTDALTTVARQLATAASVATSAASGTSGAVLQEVANQMADAIAVMAGVASSAMQTVSAREALMVTTNLEELTSSTAVVTSAAASQALDIAVTAGATLDASGESLQPTDLNPLVNVAANAAAAATAANASSSGSAGRRLMQLSGGAAIDSNAALQALSSVASVVSSAQALVLSTMASLRIEDNKFLTAAQGLQFNALVCLLPSVLPTSTDLMHASHLIRWPASPPIRWAPPAPFLLLWRWQKRRLQLARRWSSTRRVLVWCSPLALPLPVPPPAAPPPLACNSRILSTPCCCCLSPALRAPPPPAPP